MPSADRDFIATVQARLDETPPDATQTWFLDMLARVRALPAPTGAGQASAVAPASVP